MNNMKKNPSAILITALIAFIFPATILAQPSATKSNVVIIQSAYESFAKADIPAVLAIMDPKVEWNEAENMIYGNNKPLIGPDAVVSEVFMKIGAEWDNFTIANLQVTNMDNNMVLATGRYQAKYKKNGAALDAQVAHLWTLKEGKVIRFQQYTDTRQFSELIRK